jgi:hypothetical protein
VLASLGAVGPGVDATGPIRTHAARALDAIVKAIDAEGQFLWRTSRLTTTSIAGTASYALNALAFAVDEPVSYLQTGGTSRVPLRAMSADDYMSLPDRTTTARVPSRYYIEKTLSTGREALTMIFYPVPDTTGDTIEYRAALRAKDFNTGATHPDFPSNWVKCLKYGLTADLAPAYRQPELVGQFMTLFTAEKAAQIGNDNEKQGVFFVPWGAY